MVEISPRAKSRMTVMSSDHRTDRRGLVIPHGDWPTERSTVGATELVRRFANTISLETGADLLATPHELARWFTDEQLPPLLAPRWTDVHDAQLLRTLIRQTIQDSASTRQALTEFASEYPVGLTFTPTTSFQPVGLRRRASLAFVVAALWTSVHDGTFTRLGACENAHCQWIVFDHSKNRTNRWCSERACGGRARSQRYRDRIRSTD